MHLPYAKPIWHTRTMRVRESALQATCFDDFAGVDSLEAPAFAVTVAGAQLTAGMVILDRVLGVPSVGLDHRVRATPRSGSIAFFVHDFDEGGWRRMEFRPGSTYCVVAHQIHVGSIDQSGGIRGE